MQRSKQSLDARISWWGDDIVVSLKPFGLIMASANLKGLVF